MKNKFRNLAALALALIAALAVLVGYTLGMNRTSPSGPVVLTSQQFVLESRHDLVKAVGEPVNGVFELLNGSYTVKTGFDLDMGESMAVRSGRLVALLGSTPALSTITAHSDVEPMLLVESSATLRVEGVKLENEGLRPPIRSSGEVIAVGVELLASSSTVGVMALDILGGVWTSYACNIESEEFYAVTHSGGVFQDTSSVFTSNTFSAVSFTAPFPASFTTQGSSIIGSRDGLQVSGTGRAELVNTLVSMGEDNRSAISCGSSGQLTLVGGRVTTPTVGALRFGVRVNGNFPSLSINGTRFDSVNTAIGRTAGGQERAMLSNVDILSNVDEGVAWNVVPSGGLSIVGGSNTAATPFVGFTAASARVNVKGVLGAGALLTETPIVP